MPEFSALKLQARRTAAELFQRSSLLSVFQRWSSPSWKILTYHRIIRPEGVSYPLQPGMYVTPETFEMQMEFLARNANVVPLSELLSALQNGYSLRKRTVVVTIDDGWRDNYDNAFPILKTSKIPATIFLATSFIGAMTSFWTDQLVQSLVSLRKQRDFQSAVFNRIDRLSSCPVALREQLKRIVGADGSSMISIADRAVEALKAMERRARLMVIDEISRLSREFSSPPAERAFLNWEEVAEMKRGGVCFASHSHHHENMAELGELHLQDEIVESLQLLKQHDIPPLGVFCYPGGYHNALSQRVLAEQGVAFVCSTSRQSILAACPKLLGRVGIHEDISSSPALFAARIWAPRF